MTREREKASFNRIVAPHLADAYSLARWLSKNSADADDIVQEACMRAFRAIDSYAGGSTRAWVLTIVRRTAYSWLSKNRSASVVSIDDLNFDDRASVELGSNVDSGGETTPEANLIAKADAAQLERAISTLPLMFRETLVLRDVQGLGYREIAEITGVPLGTVMSRLARGRRRVLQQLAVGEECFTATNLK